MITLNGKKFSRNNREFVSSLFDTGATCIGFYKPLKNQIKLYDHQNNHIGAITKNRVLACATKRGDKYWYSYADIKLIGKFESYTQECNEIETTLKLCNIV